LEPAVLAMVVLMLSTLIVGRLVREGWTIENRKVRIP